MKSDVDTQDDNTANVSAFVEKVKRYTEIKERTLDLVNEFIYYSGVKKRA